MKHRSWSSLLALAVLLAAPAAAQQTTLTFRGGLSLATVGGDDVEDAESRSGFYGGGALTIGLANNVGLLLGAAYAQKGATLPLEGGVEGTVALDYIEVPAMLSLSIPTGGQVVPRFAAGAAVSFKASCSLEGESGDVSVSLDCDEADVETTSTDFGILGGAGLSVGTGGPISITLDVLYNYGLSSLDDSTTPDDVKNRAWSFLGGIEIPIGTR